MKDNLFLHNYPDAKVARYLLENSHPNGHGEADLKDLLTQTKLALEQVIEILDKLSHQHWVTFFDTFNAENPTAPFRFLIKKQMFNWLVEPNVE
jgi:hypothetical protein